MPKAPLKSVADDTAGWRGTGSVHPETASVLLEEVGELLLGHTRLDDDVAEAIIIFKNAIEPTEVEKQTGVRKRNGRTVTPVLAGTDWMNLKMALGGQSQADLDFGDGAGPEDGWNEGMGGKRGFGQIGRRHVCSNDVFHSERKVEFSEVHR